MESQSLSSTSLLEVKNLRKLFPIHGGFFSRVQAWVHAIDGVSLQLNSGETLGLVGESGCGKSTLGRTILRLYEPTSGQIFFRGQDIASWSQSQLRPQRRHMQMIFQDPFSSLNPRMTVGSILSEPFWIHKMGDKAFVHDKVQHLLRVVGLAPEAADRYPHEFSGGQRQRVGIARALALEPNLIIADEPVSVLDVSIQSQILNLLVELREAFQLTYLFIAHDLAVIEHISDRVAVMYLGKIVEMASTAELFSRPAHPYTRALMAAIPEPTFEGKKEKFVLKGDIPSPISPPSGCHFHPRCPKAMDICKREAPVLKTLRQDDGGNVKQKHQVSCHLYT